MKDIVTVALIVLVTSSGVLAQEGRGSAPPPPPLQPGASQADVDVACLPHPRISATRPPSSNGSPTSPTTH